MKKLILILVAAVIIGGAYVGYDRFVRVASPEGGINNPEENNQYTTYRNKNIGLEFMYRGGIDGYVLTERGESTVVQGGPKQSISLMLASDKAELDASTSPREGPPTMLIRIYDNTQKQTAAVWVTKNMRESNYEMKIEDEQEVVVGGANAIRYTRDGLYQADVYAVAHGSRIYLFDGSYADVSAPIRKDFSAILASLKFISGQE